MKIKKNGQIKEQKIAFLFSWNLSTKKTQRKYTID